jgi:LPXTG-motif cell wall-anchored protein
MRRFGLYLPLLAVLASLAVSSSVSAQQAVLVPIGAGRDEASAPGTATLTAQGNQTQVVLRVAGTNPEMLAHIHADVCPGVGPIVFPLTNVRNGTSTTTVDASLAEIMAQGKSINLHRSPDQAGIYVGCGDLAAAQATGGGAAQVPRALPRTGDVGSLAPLAAAVGAGLLGLGYALRRRIHR